MTWCWIPFLVNTTSFGTPEIPDPVLHAFTLERKTLLEIPPEVRFSEVATFWDPSWTIARRAIQTKTIVDPAASAAAIGQGTLLSPASYQEQTFSSLAGFGVPSEGCATCMTLSERAPYGLGIWVLGDWLARIPASGGYGAFMGYLPGRKLAIAVAVTVNGGAFYDGDTFYLPKGDARWRRYCDPPGAGIPPRRQQPCEIGTRHHGSGACQEPSADCGLLSST